jgi:lysozyme family protein
MANIKELVAFISRCEGGFTNDPSDSGGPTNRGVTLVTWKKVGYDKDGDGIIDEKDVTRITHEEMVEVVLRPHFWDVWQADKINNQSIANLLVDWLWTSGHRTIFMVQKILGVKVDGVVGPQTLHALNNFPDQGLLFDRIKISRINDIHRICKQRKKNMRFKRGWLNRIAAIKFIPVVVLFILLCNLMSCRTSDSCTTSSKTENNLVEQEVSADHHQSLSTTFNQFEASMSIDSITETTIVAFKLLSKEDSVSQLFTVPADGKVIITRNKKVVTTVHRNKQEAKGEAKHDSCYMQSAVVKSVKDQSKVQAGKHPVTTANRVKSVLTVLMIALLALWIYYVFRRRKLF